MYFCWYNLKPRLHCPGVSRQFVVGGLGGTGMNCEEIRVRLYIPGSAKDQTWFGAKSDHGLSRLCYGLRRCIPGVASEALRCVPVRPHTHGSAPGIGGRAPVSLRRVTEVGR